jgi:anti-anti-sigma factor
MAELTFSSSGGRLEAVVRGDLDMDASFRFESELDRRLAGAGVDHLDLDLAGVEFIDSAGLGALLSTRERAEVRRIGFTISRPSPPVRRLLELTGAGASLSG